VAIAHVQTVATSTAGASSVTHVNLAVGSGTNRSLVAYVIIDDAGSTTTHVDSVVFNGAENFTYRTKAVNLPGGANTLAAEVWTLDNPTDATANVVATASESCSGITIIISEYTGANNGIGANTGSATGLSVNPSTTFNTGLATSVICSGVAAHATDRAFAPGVGTTERHEGYNGTSVTNYVGMEENASAGADTIDTTFDGAASYWAIAAIELQAAAAGGPIALEATVTAASATGAPVLNVARVMTGTLTSATATPGPVLNVARVMTATLTAVTVTPTPALLIMLPLSATLTAATVTPSAVLAVARVMSATATGATATPDTGVLSVARALTAAMLAETLTNAPVLNVARVMTAALTAATATPDTAVLVVLRYLSATSTAATATPDTGVLNVARVMSAALLAETATPAPVLNVARVMTATLTAVTLTSTPDLLTAGFLALAATITAETSTSAVALNVLRALTSSVTAATVTPTVLLGPACSLTILRSLSAQLLAATATPDTAVLLVARLMVAAMLAQTNTPLADLSVPVAGADAWWLRVPVILGGRMKVG